LELIKILKENIPVSFNIHVRT